MTILDNNTLLEVKFFVQQEKIKEMDKLISNREYFEYDIVSKHQQEGVIEGITKILALLDMLIAGENQ